MIIQQDVSAPVITSIGATPTKFKIKASAKAFKILSGFYSEPILAIPRELGANAWDAHVKAKNTNKMFEVHAPNSLEPWFSIRDFGVGLSPTDIEQIYTTYFESTKTGENDSDGCMGLGSKTPFNYTENFMVTSYFNGTKHTYSCFIDGSGSPNIMPVSNDPTTEHNGLEIKFGVKIADISMFVDKVTRAYEPFRFRPTIVGANITFAPRQYSFEGTNWALKKKSTDRYTKNDNRAFMGNYSYPISYEALRGYMNEHAKDSDIKNKIYNMLSGGGFDFFFNIGDLEVAPNKEQLQYDADHRTASAIYKMAEVALRELHEKINSQLAVPKTMWEAMSLYLRYNSYGGEFSQIRGIIGDINIKFNGVNIESGNESVDSVNLKLKLTTRGLDIYSAPKLPEKFTVGSLSYRRESDKFVIRDRGHYTSNEKGEFPIFFYTNDDNLKKTRIRHFLKTKFPLGNIPEAMIVIDKSLGFKVFKAHCAYLGVPDTTIYNIEELPIPPRAPREKTTATTDEIHFVHTSWFEKVSHRDYFSWGKQANTFDSNETYYYVDFYYSDPVTPENGSIGEAFNNMIRFLIDKEVISSKKVETIWGINVKNKRLLKTGKWINVYELAKKEVEKHRKEIEQSLFVLSQAGAVARTSSFRGIFNNTDLKSKLKNKNTIKVFSDLITLATQVNNAENGMVPVAKLFGIVAKEHSPLISDVATVENLLANKYMGIFNMLNQYSYNTENLAKIINFIDEKS